jgi:hypothetical protein
MTSTPEQPGRAAAAGRQTQVQALAAVTRC